MPVSQPILESISTNSSVAIFPVAPGEYGQPPNPPTELSNLVIPACMAAILLARAIFLVS
jgi:hypothetical protein